LAHRHRGGLFNMFSNSKEESLMNFIIQNYSFVRNNGQQTGPYDAISLGVISTGNKPDYFNANNVELSKEEWDSARTQADVITALSDLVRTKIAEKLPTLTVYFSTVNENTSSGTATINFTTNDNTYFGNGHIQSTIDEWHLAMDSDDKIVALIKQKISDSLTETTQA
jgi:hypothetical protein